MLLITFIFPTNNALASKATAEEVVDYALQFQGTPYLFGGTSPNTGFDCSGYLRYVMNHFDISIPRTSADQYRVGEHVARSDLKIGDFVFFENTYKRGISHSGIYVGDNQFISAKSSGVRTESLDNSYWAPRYVGAKRIIEEPEKEIVVKEVVYETLPLGKYHDLPSSHWGYDAVYEMSQKGIINGFEQSHFRPDQSITRAQAAVIINRELKLTAENPSTFPDVSKSSSAYPAIAALQEVGIITGLSNGTFQPDEPITRAQMAVILNRAYELTQEDVSIATKNSFTDVTPEHAAFDAIELLKANGITAGYPDGTFKPDNFTTRVEFTVFLYRIIQ